MILTPIPNLEQSHQLPGNVSATVVRMNGGDLIHRAALNDVLHKSIEAEAAAHGIAIQEQNFDGVLNAIASQKVQAFFMMVSWENCRRKVAAGGTEFATVITEWDGKDFKHYPATHGEDTYAIPDLSQQFRHRTQSAEYPKGLGLGTFFMHQRIKLAVMKGLGSSPFDMVSRGRVAEYSSHSLPMVKLLTTLGADLGTEQQGTILQLNGFPRELRQRQKFDVLTEGLGKFPGHVLPNIFVTSWMGDKGERIVASFTEAISTFSGQPIVRVQFSSNRMLPENERLQDVLASLIMAGRDEILARQKHSASEDWNMDNTHMMMRIHALNESEIGLALQMIGAKPRKIGDHLMLPVVTNFKNVSKDVLRFSIPAATPFLVTSSTISRRQAPRVLLNGGLCGLAAACN